MPLTHKQEHLETRRCAFCWDGRHGPTIQQIKAFSGLSLRKLFNNCIIRLFPIPRRRLIPIPTTVDILGVTDPEKKWVQYRNTLKRWFIRQKWWAQEFPLDSHSPIPHAKKCILYSYGSYAIAEKIVAAAEYVFQNQFFGLYALTV